MKQRDLIIIGSIIIVLALVLIMFPKNTSKGKEIIKNGSLEIKDPSMVSLMLETAAGSGEYESSSDNTWPSEGYEFNSTLSKCENGGQLSYDASTNRVILETNTADKCYVYFNVIAPNITVTTNNIPTTVGPQASLSCTGNTSIYNNQYNRIEVSAMNSKYSTCNLNYTNRTSKTYLNNKIIGLSGTTQGTGQVVNEKGYRYEGKNPNNYIWFNNELWRIIGVFDAASHGQTGLNLTKIIRNESIGGLVWNKSATINWSTSSLKALLNGAYYSSDNGTGGEYCYGSESRVPANCDYRQIGIQSNYRPMIKNVTWYLGGLSSTSSDENYRVTIVDNYYKYERGTKVYSGNPTSDTGYIGLMYPSDYGYSVLASSCARTTKLTSYSTAACAGQSWLYGQSYEWTITPGSSYSNYVFSVSHYGIAYIDGNYRVNVGFAVRPVLYLDASVYVIDGDGSMSNPYIIGM